MFGGASGAPLCLSAFNTLLVDTEAEESLVMFGGAVVLHSEAEESLVMFAGAVVLHSAYLHSTLYW